MPESLGNKLKSARESRRLTLDQAADATRIRAVYLQGLENDDYSVMLSAAQGRGFLRLYTDFLGLNLDELTASARDSKPTASSAPVADSTSPADSTPEPAPASEQKPSRPGFWARLLRREPAVKEETKPAEEPAPEPLSALAGEPSAVSLAVEEEELVGSARNKTSLSEEKPKSTQRKTTLGKKKRTLSPSKP